MVACTVHTVHLYVYYYSVSTRQCSWSLSLSFIMYSNVAAINQTSLAHVGHPHVK